jgi:hypothetical protein
VRRIGVLTGPDENDPLAKTYVSAFTQALAALNWTEGRNVRLDLRGGGADANRIRALAQELVGLQSDIILTNGNVATVALQRETRTIPIVFANVSDPVASGIGGRGTSAASAILLQPLDYIETPAVIDAMERVRWRMFKGGDAQFVSAAQVNQG